MTDTDRPLCDCPEPCACYRSRARTRPYKLPLLPRR